MISLFAVAGSKNTTAELLRFLVERLERKPRALITLTPEQGRKYRVAGYTDLRPLARELAIDLLHPATYALNEADDRSAIHALGISTLFVQGWQRLIPEWFLQSLSRGAFGMHGSSEPLPKGRGRSPLNWSIIQGRTSFTTNLFRYRPGVDDGDVVGSRTFDITPADTAHTLHLKNTFSMLDLLGEKISSILDGSIAAIPQIDASPTYYPKRRPQDGDIFWEDSVEEIERFVRALTRPFPGAFTHMEDGSTLKIWRAVPFLAPASFSPAGCVIETTSTGEIVISTGTWSLLVQDWEAPRPPRPGEKLSRRAPHRWDWSRLPMDDPRYCSNYEDVPVGFRRP
jgi:methionyl-tRNA formyltransferase